MIASAEVTIHAIQATGWPSTEIARFAWVYDPEWNKIELWEPK